MKGGKLMKQINILQICDYYYINEEGSVISYFNPENPIKLKNRIDKYGYVCVSLQLKDRRRTSFTIHRLVALTFIKNPHNYPVINHKDCNKQNNNVNNLEWTTISYNTKHAYDNNLIHQGKIKKVKATNLLDGNIIIFNKMKDACEYFNCNIKVVSEICSGKQNIRKHGKLANIKFEYYEDETQTTIEKSCMHELSRVG
jgi:hypothetical protein